MFSRRRFAITLAVGACAAFSPPAVAQTYPTRPITLVVPFAAGGSTNLVARLLGQKLGEILGVTVVIENRAGAGGSTGAAAVARAEPDGSTLLYGTISTHTLNPMMAKRQSYDPVKDFEPVALIGSIPNVLVVNPDIPAKTVAELIAAAKTDPAKYSYASSGVATPLHLSGELFNRMAGTAMAHVPYRGAGPAMFDNLPSSAEFIKAGKIRALAVTTKERVKQMPDIPTMEEAGLKGYETYSWQAIFAPAKRSVVEKLNEAIVTALKDPALLERLDDLAMTVTPSSPEALGRHVVDQLAVWGPITKAAGVQVD